MIRPRYRAYLEKVSRKPKVYDFTTKGIITATDLIKSELGIYINTYKIEQKWYEAGEFEILALFLKQVNPYSLADEDGPDYSSMPAGVSRAEIRMNYFVFEAAERKIFPVLRTNKTYEILCSLVLRGKNYDFFINIDFALVKCYVSLYSEKFVERAYLIKQVWKNYKR